MWAEHLKEEEEIKKQENSVKQSLKRKYFPESVTLDGSGQTKIKHYFRTEKLVTVTAAVKPKDVLDGIVELLTVNGRPFSLLTDSGFERAFGPILKASDLSVNTHNVKTHIHERSEYVANKIRRCKNTLISLKIDCVTRLDRSFIGINMQLIEDGVIKVFNLATTELSVRHTGENLKKVILQSIAKFDIKADNIYSVTTDNGSNLLKAVQGMSEAGNKRQESCPPQFQADYTDNEESNLMNDPEIGANDELVESLMAINWHVLKITSELLFLCQPHSIFYASLYSVKPFSSRL